MYIFIKDIRSKETTWAAWTEMGVGDGIKKELIEYEVMCWISFSEY